MDLFPLKVFLAVAEEGSLSAAARRLNLSQPAVSFHVEGLERFYGTRLFERHNRGVILTESGTILQKYAEEILVLNQRAQDDIAEIQGLARGRLVVAASTIPGEHVLPHFVSLFLARYPGIGVAVRIAGSGQVTALTLSRAVDLGVVGAPPGEPQLDCEPFVPDELVVIAPPGHELADGRTVVLGDLIRYPLVMREPTSGTRQVVEAELRRLGVDTKGLHIKLEVGTTGAAKTAVEVGLGLSFVSRWAVSKELAMGRLYVVPVRGLRLQRDLFLVSHRGRLLTQAASKFWRFLRDDRTRRQVMETLKKNQQFLPSSLEP